MPFHSLYKNDELMFNSVCTNIPSLSLQKYPFDEYHTSFDTPEKIQKDSLGRAFDITMNIVYMLENDFVYRQVNPVPYWITKFNMSSDSDKEDYKMKFRVVYEFMDGVNSLLEIANKVNYPFEDIHKLAQKMKYFNLISQVK